MSSCQTNINNSCNARQGLASYHSHSHSHTTTPLTYYQHAPSCPACCTASMLLYARNSLYTYLGLFLGGSPRLWQQNRRCVSSCMLLSSDQMTSSKPFVSKASLMFAVAHSHRFTLLASRMIWQYALPRNVQPSACLQRRTVRIDR